MKQIRDKNSESGRSIGEVLKGRYEVVEVLGSGGNATTYRCLDKESQDYVAVKELNFGRMSSWKQYELFEREAQVLQQLNHPAIPKYLDYFEEGESNFVIAQSLAPGTSLADQVLNKGWRATKEQVYEIAEQLLDVLNYLGSLSPPVIHRDIKPENVIVNVSSYDGVRIFLVDFGATASNAFIGGNSTIVGTYGYMAPEQFRGMASPSSDLYSVGATLLFLVSARHPWQFPQTQRMMIEFQSDLPVQFQTDKLSDIIEGLLEPIAEDRMTAREAIMILKDLDPKTSSIRIRQSRKPAGARSTIEKRGSSSVSITIPPKGLGADAIMPASFAIAWNSIVATWTFTALTSVGILPALFSIPFWVAGVQVGRSALAGSFIRENLTINRQKFKITRAIAFFKDGQRKFDEGQVIAEGRSFDLVEARIISTMIVNGKPLFAIEVTEGVKKHLFGQSLEKPEQEWLVQEINDVVQNIQKASVKFD